MGDSTADQSIAELPHHLAIIMDGNGRWAKAKGLPRIEGHRQGVRSVRSVAEACRKKGVRYLTLFSFSSENWQRDKDEVSGLMDLLKAYLDAELHTMLKNGIRLRAIGELDRLPYAVQKALKFDIERTKDNTEMDLILAVSYSGRDEILAASRALAERAVQGEITPDSIDAEMFSSALWTADIPEPDLLIRTSGEMRVSNFLLWQIAYSEIVVTPEYWPDFDEAVLDKCLAEYSSRERRFGLTSEQIRAQKGAA